MTLYNAIKVGLKPDNVLTFWMVGELSRKVMKIGLLNPRNAKYVLVFQEKKIIVHGCDLIIDLSSF